MSNIIAKLSQSIPFPTDSQKPLPWAPIIASAVFSYAALCSVLRFQRRNAMQKKFNYADEASLSKMTNVDAQAIIEYLAELEFPLMYEKSLQFALFKVSVVHITYIISSD